MTIDPVKLAERHDNVVLSITEPGRKDFHRDTATALRLLAEYAEAAWAEVDELRAVNQVPTSVPLVRALARTDAALAALTAAGIRIGGGE